MIGDSNGPDPFVRFPNSTSPLDQKLFHFLMIHASQRLYGPQQQAGFDYIRDVTMPKVLLGNEVMSWITYSAATMRNTLSRLFSETWLLERRMHNYQLLRQMVDRPLFRPWDYKISTIVSAGYIEYSYGQVSEGFMHIKAALELIRQQDEGLRCLQTMLPVYANTILMTTSITGLPMVFDIITPFRDALTEVMHSFETLQIRNRVMRHDRDDGDTLIQPREREPSFDDTSKKSYASFGRYQYWEIRRRSLEVQPLHSYLQTKDLPEGQAYEWRSRLITLYLINSILINLSWDETVAKQFLLGLKAMITNSMDPYAARTLHMFIPLIAVCAQRLGIWAYHGSDSPLPPIRVWEAILFAEVMMLARYGVRQRVMNVMVHWLYTGREELHDQAVLGEAELLMFSVHISENWEAKTKTH